MNAAEYTIDLQSGAVPEGSAGTVTGPALYDFATWASWARTFIPNADFMSDEEVTFALITEACKVLGANGTVLGEQSANEVAIAVAVTYNEGVPYYQW